EAGAVHPTPVPHFWALAPPFSGRVWIGRKLKSKLAFRFALYAAHFRCQELLPTFTKKNEPAAETPRPEQPEPSDAKPSIYYLHPRASGRFWPCKVLILLILLIKGGTISSRAKE